MKSETIVTTKELPPDVVNAIRNGHKIEAIKLLRVATGIGLANAKVLVDAAIRQQGPQRNNPAIVQGDSNSLGLLKLLMVLLVAFGAYQYILN